MHCPLCKAQYKAGYDLCGDCDADLVFTKEQADAEDVVLFLESANLTGVGGIAFPCGMSKSGLPIGVQLQAPPFEEERLLRGAAMFQQATDWHTRTPPLMASVAKST